METPGRRHPCRAQDSGGGGETGASTPNFQGSTKHLHVVNKSSSKHVAPPPALFSPPSSSPFQHLTPPPSVLGWEGQLLWGLAWHPGLVLPPLPW